ncbi:MAG TPA: hypothetical protein VF729_08230, partial [Solirubrobacterales bacterium]
MSGVSVDLASPTPAPDRGVAIVWGLLARYPYGGVTWQAMHHLAALRRLGFDVWYVEDSDSRVYSPTTHCPTMEFEENVAFLERWMGSLGMPDRWIFRPPGEGGAPIVADERELERLYSRAEVVLNL